MTTLPRTFTRREVASLTHSAFALLSPPEREAYNQAWWAAISEPPIDLRDYDRVGSNRRFELGE